jgi:heme exporter protein C
MSITTSQPQNPVTRVVPKPSLGFHWEHIFGGLGLALFVVGQIMGLGWAPSDAHMGEVSRILYVHVPAAWISMILFTVGFVCSVGYLFTGRRGFDWASEGAVEVGVLLNGLLLVLGSLFARPTWGVWWSWDPRLTASAIMLLTFVGVVLLRQVIEDLDRRSLWASVVTVLAFVNIPVTYMSVRWWRSLHQEQSSSSSMNPAMWGVLQLNALAFLLLAIWMVVRRYRIAHHRAYLQAPDELPQVQS